MCNIYPDRKTCRYCKYSRNPNFFDTGCAYPEPVGASVPIDLPKYRKWKATVGKVQPYKNIDINWSPVLYQKEADSLLYRNKTRKRGYGA